MIHTNLNNRDKAFQEGTRTAMTGRYWRIMVPVALVTGLLAGLEVSWLTGNWWLLLPFASGISLCIFVLARLFSGGVRPTVRCRTCGAHGWIADLASTDGTCPHCSGTQFDYARWYVKGANIPYRITLGDVCGRDLLTLRAQNDLKYI